MMSVLFLGVRMRVKAPFSAFVTMPWRGGRREKGGREEGGGRREEKKGGEGGGHLNQRQEPHLGCGELIRLLTILLLNRININITRWGGCGFTPS